MGDLDSREDLNLYFNQLRDVGGAVKLGITKGIVSRKFLKKARDLTRHSRPKERILWMIEGMLFGLN